MNVDRVVPRARILGTGSCLPERVIDNRALEAGLATSDAWIRAHTGIGARRSIEDGETTSDLALVAARRAIEAAGLSAADLDMILLATSTGDSPLPATAAHLQQKLGADLIPSLDVNASSAGFLYALTVAEQFIAAGTFKTILVVAADAPTRFVAPDDRTARIMFGDGAGAVVLGESSGESGILSSTIHADGSFGELMGIPGGGSAEPLDRDALDRGRQYLRVDGARLRELTVRHLTSCSMQALKAARLTSAELDWVVPQQGNLRIVETISERLGFPMTRFVLDTEEVGNTLAASIPIALDRAVRAATVTPGQTVLLCALGAGITWGAAIIRL
ncbi:MAG: ketoacyl-ACP synthase III [Deltaproteobacteria bacterium]|nr:ketoacyl-ACP synthase III [Deltaproteobacteria bacterium]